MLQVARPLSGALCKRAPESGLAAPPRARGGHCHLRGRRHSYGGSSKWEPERCRGRDRQGPRWSVVSRGTTFVRRTQGIAAIGALGDAAALLRGEAGSRITSHAVDIEWAER